MLALYLGIRQFLVEARYIPSGSMKPGLQIQDRLLVEKLTYRTRSPKRGEIVVFNSPYAFDPALRSPQKPSPFSVLSSTCLCWDLSQASVIQLAMPTSSG